MERGSSVRGGTRATWRMCWNPDAFTGASDLAGGNGSHHTSLRSPTAKPGVRAEYTSEIRCGPDGGVTPVKVPEAYGAGRLGGRVSRR